MKILVGFLTAALLGGCGSAAGNRSEDIGADGFQIGVNVASIDYYSGTGPFLNLIYGSSWQMQDTGGDSRDIPATSLDANGWVTSAPSGYRVIRALSVPNGGGRVICTYRGAGALNASGRAVSDVSMSAGITSFSLADVPDDPGGARLTYKIDPSNHIRDIDCRLSRAARTEAFTPEFVSALKGFGTIRVMKWQSATEGNWPVRWETRNKPGDADYQKNDGVPVELMVEAANRVGADLWVTVPWNADDDYVRNFAAYVRDNLGPDHQVYVEVSNEVWNAGYPVAAQAQKEAEAEGLPSATGSGRGGKLERYAEKTVQVMAIWSKVFGKGKSRVVRVAAFQHVSPYFSDLLLKYKDLSKSVDALATAPYFGYEANDAMSVDQIFSALPAEIDSTVRLGLQQKAIAEKYGLRYITYEAGQSVVLPKNVALEQQVQRDPRMAGAYRQFINSWRDKVGGRLNLFSLNGGIGPYGGWGLVEYLGQPPSQAPKMRAAREFFRTSKKSRTN